MRIVHVVSHYNSMMKYQEYYLAKEQVIQGHEVHIVTSNRNFPFTDYENTAASIYGMRILPTGSFDEEGIHIHRLPALFEHRARVFLRKLHPTIAGIEPDVIIIHGIVNISAILLLINKVKARYVFDDHMLYQQISRAPLSKLFYFWFRLVFRKKILSTAEKIVAISEGCVPTINEVYGIPRKRIQMISLGADARMFHFDKNLREVQRNKLKIGKEAVVVLFTGKIIEGKKPHLITEALNMIEIDKEIHVLFVGNFSSGYKDLFMSEVAKSAHPYTIVPHVETEELVAMYCAADLAVYPVQATISTVEASACGLPIICTDEIPERYKNGNGIGIEPGNPEQLKSALEVLLKDEKKRKKMGKLGRRYVEQELSWSIVSQRFLE